MEGTDALRALRTKRRYIAAGLLLGLAVAAFLNWSAERRYESTTQFFVDVTPESSESRDPYGNQQFSQQRIVTYAQVLTGRELAQQVVDDLGLPITAVELTEMVTATPLPDTVVLEVTVTDTAPDRAQLIATSVAENFINRVRQLETPEGVPTPTVEVEVMEPPTYNASPVSPATARTLTLGGALGLLLGIGMALLSVRMDRSLRSEEELVAAAGAEVLGRVPADRQLTRRHLASGTTTGQSAVAEAFRTIGVNLQHVGPQEQPRVVVVAGAMPGDGASTVAVNLAVSLARSGSRVLLVDGDLRRPRVARGLGLPTGPGLTDVLAGAVELREATVPWGESTLTVLDAGPLPAEPAEQLGSPAMRSLLAQTRDDYDQVIVDAPPLLSVVDGAVLSALADGCLVVARFGRTTQDQLAEAMAAISRVRADVLGLVVNRMPSTTTPSGGRRSYAPDTGRRHTGDHALPARGLGEDAREAREAQDSQHGATRHRHAAEEPDALPITGALPPPAPPNGRPPEAWSGSAHRGPGAPPPAAT
ncbi:polysaccharide biosynthesis tyrosine autokinase [Blastococcus sp. SYSU DS0539]